MDKEMEEDVMEKENQSVKRSLLPEEADVEDVVHRKRQAGLAQSRLPTVTRHTLAPSSQNRSWKDILGAPPVRGSTKVHVGHVCVCTFLFS